MVFLLINKVDNNIYAFNI